MIVHEVQSHLVSGAVNFFVGNQLLVVTYAQSGKYKLAELCEYTVVVVLADREVDVVTCNHVEVHGAQLADVSPLSLVLISVHIFRPEAVP